MLSRLLINLLILFLDHGSYDRRGAIAVEIDPGSVGVLVPLDLLQTEHQYVLDRARRYRQLVLVDFNIFEAICLEDVCKSCVVHIVVVDFLGRTVSVTLTRPRVGPHRFLVRAVILFFP